MDCERHTVGRWRHRYLTHGLKGLQDAPRSGRPPRFSPSERVDVLSMLGVPYGEAINRAPQMARAQADSLARSIESEGGPKGLQDKQIVALVAYLQRLGRDIKAPQVARSTP
jgi:hypothetical protein